MRETSAMIDMAAAAWIARIDRAPLDDIGQADLDAWLAGDIRRRGAFVRAQAVLLHVHRARALGQAFDPDAYLAEHDGGTPGIDDADAPDTAIAAPSRRRVLALAVSVAAGTVGGIALFTLGFPSPAQAYETKRGEVRLVPLPDGSQMILNTASRASVTISDRERRVDLGGGEALFEVAHDRARPFTVRIGDTRICALGTGFTVRNLPGEPVEVLVQRGLVEIAASETPPLRLPANMRAIVTAGVPIRTEAVDPAEVGRELAWRQGMLAFEDAPLVQAAAEFARYSDRRIVFADPSIGRETVTGLYALNDPNGFAESAALSLGLRAKVTPGGVVLIR